MQEAQKLEALFKTHYHKDIAFQGMVKNLIFGALFVIVAAGGISMVLYPKIKDFRTQDIDAKQQRIIEMRQQKNFASVFRSYYAIRQENSDVLKPPSYERVADTISAILNQHFSQVQIQEKNRKIDPSGRFFHEELQIKAMANHLDDLYKFLDSIVGMSAHVQVDFPLSITKTKKAFILAFGIHIDYGAIER
ncbi:hypothetical protein HSUHS5_1190 [Helicobacter suis HS5]|uniref:Uncharacterized protein n=1 Tax=Helicobacter suis HS5 TaxID=710394 RepID=E7G5A7_9HELI|nr:hypothetical protein [Helicobacter suis]EFX41472.1 hypothetical protein HSUHS5_1190 [Helicobacter suis HS5]